MIKQTPLLRRTLDSSALVFIRALVTGALFLSYAAQGATGPAAPQGMTGAPSDHGSNLGTSEIDLNQSLFVDDGNYCRYVTNAGPAAPETQSYDTPLSSPGTNLVVDLFNQTEWASFRSAPGMATMQVCCRPSTTKLCTAASSGAQSVPIVGSDSDNGGTFGYALAGHVGSASATCPNEPYGTYTETATFRCVSEVAGAPGTGVNADGVYATELADVPACGATPSYTVTQAGNCSASGGGGQEYQTKYNACGELVSSGYIGPSCNTQSCCTTDYQKTGCSATTAIYTDEGTCHSGSYTVPGGCREEVSNGSCGPESCSTLADGFKGCSCYGGSWTWSNPAYAWTGACTTNSSYEVDINDWEPNNVTCVSYQ